VTRNDSRLSLSLWFHRNGDLLDRKGFKLQTMSFYGLVVLLHESGVSALAATDTVLQSEIGDYCEDFRHQVREM
jgi:hypothetical protein